MDGFGLSSKSMGKTRGEPVDARAMAGRHDWLLFRSGLGTGVDFGLSIAVQADTCGKSHLVTGLVSPTAARVKQNLQCCNRVHADRHLKKVSLTPRRTLSIAHIKKRHHVLWLLRTGP